MSSQRKKTRPPRRSSGILLGASIAVAVSLLQFIGAFNGLERRALDLDFIARGEKEPHPDIVLVTIDEVTRKALGKATNAITRPEYAKALDNLTGAGARIVTFDLDLATPRDGDDILAQSIACSGRAILSCFIAMGDWVRSNPMFREPRPCVVEGVVSDVPASVAIDENSVARINWRKTGAIAYDGYRVYYSVEPFKDPDDIAPGTGGHIDVAASENFLDLSIEGVPVGTVLYTAVRGLKMGSNLGEGAVNIIEDPDARVRRIPIIVARSPMDPGKKASLSLETAVWRLFHDEPIIINSTLWELTLQKGGRWLHIPLVDGNMIINYRGGRDTYPRISFSDVLAGSFDPEAVRGKIVLLGNTHQLAHDEYPTPFGRQKLGDQDKQDEGISTGYTSGLEIHANALDTIISRDFIYPLPLALERALSSTISDNAPVRSLKLRMKLWNSGYTLLAGVLAILLLMVWKTSLPMGAGAFAALEFLLVVVAFVSFAKLNVWMPLAGPLISVAVVYAGALLHRARLHEREKTWIKETFGKYLAPTVVEEITRNPELVELGGTEKELTAFFSDIQKFSTISEQLGSARLLVELLNQYLSAMADVIEQYGGTIDKYEGDAIMAFWGAPVHFPDHAVRACNACLDMQKQLGELREGWRITSQWPELVNSMRVRMGLNTGPMVVGNMGSEGRMNYTIMGDAVNLASRLEGANKAFGTLIMISESTYAQVRGEFECRYLDRITVVGKREPVKVYELMSRKGELDEVTLRMLRLYNDGVAEYEKRNWKEAIEAFEAASGLVNEDGPSMAYIERCKRFSHDPPPDDWDGVYKLEEK